MFLKKISLPQILLIAIVILTSFLRLWNLNKVPVSLFGDELDVGYQAYSVLKTGKDYSGNFLPFNFQSLAEWRTPLYLYSSVPTVAIFGITPWGVRLPAAIFGILGVVALYLLIKEVTKNEWWGLTGAFFLGISPWHIQYSRAGFEVTELLFFIVIGLFFFFKALKNEGKYLWLSGAFLVLTPWIYSTAKLFTPLLLAFLFLAFRKEILSFSKKQLISTIIVMAVLGLPVAYSTLFGGGTQRFGYISVFTDPTVAPEIGVARLRDSNMRGDNTMGVKPTLLDRAFHNKIVSWSEIVVTNYLKSFSTDFLFVKGDPNPRHSIGIGEFYRIDALLLILGLVFFVTKFENKKVKALVLFWILIAPLPASITRDGGDHATRLILMLPPLILLSSYGLIKTFELLKKIPRKMFLGGYLFILLISFIFYLHQYWVHYPWDSERWWHAGFKETFQAMREVEKNYDRVFISMAGEPVWIFFAGWNQFPPDKWHQGYPFAGTYVDGFGQISYIDKYYFGAANEHNATIYDLPKFITSKDLYIAVAKENPWNLIMEPSKVPPGLKLIKAIPYPSGEPAFYLFTSNK